jgi:hypothetical protein
LHLFHSTNNIIVCNFSFADPVHHPSVAGGESADFLGVNKEIYDFMWQKMGGIAGSLQVYIFSSITILLMEFIKY